MKELKFICPSCGQHIQCDGNHTGENVPCPGCATLIRVPRDASVTDAPESPPAAANPFAPDAEDSEKVSYTCAKTVEEEKESPTTAGHPISKQRPDINSTPPTAPKLPAAATHASELHCVCPVCQSELRISVESERSLHDPIHTAGLTRTSAEHLSPTERDQQIAAARRIALRPAMKPRLDQILGDNMDSHIEQDSVRQSSKS